jgi:hypothetical protein
MSNSLHEPINISRQYVLDDYTAKYEERRTKTSLKRLGAVVLTGALFVVGGAALKNMTPDYELSEATTTVTSEVGDTLFSLAGDIPGIEHIDTRAATEAIAELNPDTIKNGVVTPYAEITLPASVVEEGSVVDDAATPDNN